MDRPPQSSVPKIIMITPEEYSLWIIPPEHIFKKFTAIISQLSTRYSTPYFEPHVTVLADVALPEEDVLSRTSKLADLIGPFTLTLTTVSYLNEYFRCLFIKVEESEKILEINNHAKSIFNRDQAPKFMPHLSLMYGNFPAEKKEEIISEIRNDFHITFEVSSIHLVLSSSHIAPERWRKLQQFTFMKPSFSHTKS